MDLMTEIYREVLATAEALAAERDRAVAPGDLLWSMIHGKGPPSAPVAIHAPGAHQEIREHDRFSVTSPSE